MARIGVDQALIWAADPDYHPYLKRDVGKAKQLLAQAGKAGGFSFTLMISTGDPNLQHTAELIKDQLKEAGIDMSIQAIEFAKLIIREANVALSPGVGFGPGGDGYVRFALIENEQRIGQAVRNLRKGLTKL